MTFVEWAGAGAVLVFCAGMVWAAVGDMATMRIGNGLVLALAAAYAVFAPLAGLDLQLIGLSAAAAFAMLVVTFGLFAVGLLGGGDAKLAAVTTLWLGPAHVPAFVLGTALFGALLALALLAFRRASLPLSWGRQPAIARLHAAGGVLPYGPAMTLAALVLVPRTVWLAPFG